eukprot:7897298-Pyramimonas_sp.AAC.1
MLSWTSGRQPAEDRDHDQRHQHEHDGLAMEPSFPWTTDGHDWDLHWALAWVQSTVSRRGRARTPSMWSL